ncbi:aminoglycoside phosphotransferase family protein [Kribbella antibiotica]|uniref:Aminoglycoside phosphotransferase family protein n=2 Tax=Kribbella antibiotica TaxID=190195 RepID=A0A4R4ZSB9_9ACTN|nr:aminoglycoside phosphotransferase family protein [Kribbella antibiotica]
MRVEADPTWWVASAVVGERFVVKFAWSEPAALRLAHEIAVIEALSVPFLPEVVASSTDPVLLVTALVPGQVLFDVVDSIDRESAGQQLAHFLGSLHQSPVDGLPPAGLQPASTDAIRAGFPRWVRPEKRSMILKWCDWADAVLAVSRSPVLVHGDLHGGNQIWYDGRLRAVVDFETAGRGDPEYDLRLFPGTGPGLELLTSTLRHYPAPPLDTDRIMAWHLRTLLGDALWRSEAGVGLPDCRIADAWVEDLEQRFSALGIKP